MKKKFYLLSLTVLVATCTFAQDKDKDAKKAGNSISVGVEAALPVGKNLKDGYNFGIGGSAKVAINVFDGGDVTISAGYISFMGKSITVAGQTFKNDALGTIPIKAGLRFKLGGGFYGEPQLGYTIAKISGVEGNFNGFTYAANLGYMVDNSVDVSLRYEAWTKSENGASFSPSFIGLRVAYSFGM